MSILLQDNLWIPPESRIYKLAEKMHTTQERITMQLLILLIWLSAISIIFYAFFRALTLTKKIPGGLVKQSWKLLYYLIGLLGVGYLTMPLFSRLPETSRDFIIGVVSLAGAVFILKVINLFYKIIKEVGL